MYIPHHYTMPDRDEMIAFMQKYNFAVIISSNNNIPVATHLPFVITAKGENIFIRSHFAKANPHCKILGESEALIVFNEPHAYISPAHYDKALNVPTWNYLAIHARGNSTLISNQEEVINLLEEAIDSYDPMYKEQWLNLPEDYKQKMCNGIVAFEIRVTKLEGKKKLSQNKTEEEQRRIATALSSSEDQAAREIGKWMLK